MKEKRSYLIGLDFGTNSVRALVVEAATGLESGTAVSCYPSGSEGILLDDRDHNLARQLPADYLLTLEKVIVAALADAKSRSGVAASEIAAIGVDTTGSTPIPVDESNNPIAFHCKFKNNLNACAWLWKDHTSFREASAITAAAAKYRPHYLAKCGGVYSSEWYWAKLWHCLNSDEDTFDAAYSWIELQDFIPAILCGVRRPEDVVRGVCAAGHKAMFNESWGGMPDAEFLAALHPKLAALRQRIPREAFSIDRKAGALCAEWARKTGLNAGIPVAVGAFDAHLGAVGSGVRAGTLVKIVGTSTCDIMVARNTETVPDIPGMCGIVDGSVLPGYFGIEAGQSAVGDIFRWFVTSVCGGDDTLQVKLTEEARGLKPGESGLMALDWNNGNRTILVDPQLTGLIVGMTLHTSQAEIYRTLIEGTAFGALTIINRIEEYGVSIERVVCCGGISEKNDLFMQIYADVLNRPMLISRSGQTCALGAAIAGSIAAGIHPSVDAAVEAMTGVREKVFQPDSDRVEVYGKLYKIYKTLHDAFGVSGKVPVNSVMKDLLAVKQGD